MALSIHDRVNGETVDQAPDTVTPLQSVIRSIRQQIPTLPEPVMIGKVEHTASASWGMDVAFLLECSISGYIDYSASAYGNFLKTVKWRIEDGVPGEVISHIMEALPMLIPQTEKLRETLRQKRDDDIIMSGKSLADIDDIRPYIIPGTLAVDAEEE